MPDRSTSSHARLRPDDEPDRGCSGTDRRLRAALVALCVFGAARLLFSFCEFTPWIPKVDFNARYNEVLCLRAGHDPYDVFTGRVSIPCVVSMADLPTIAVVPLMQRLPSFPDFGKEGQKEMAIHTYPPWSYAWLLPWTCIGFSLMQTPSASSQCSKSSSRCRNGIVASFA